MGAEQYLLAAVAALAGVISVLWVQLLTNHRECVKRDEECRVRETRQAERLAVLEAAALGPLWKSRPDPSMQGTDIDAETTRKFQRTPPI